MNIELDISIRWIECGTKILMLRTEYGTIDKLISPTQWGTRYIGNIELNVELHVLIEWKLNVALDILIGWIECELNMEMNIIIGWIEYGNEYNNRVNWMWKWI